jgi:hypothetical protein
MRAAARLPTAAVRQRKHARRAQAPRLELSRKLRDHAPLVRGRRSHEGDRERVFDGQRTVWRANFRWANRDQLPRTYVNSRATTLT